MEIHSSRARLPLGPIIISAALLFLPILTPAQGTPAPTAAKLVTHLDPDGRRMTEPAVIERGLHHRVWERIEVETGPDGREFQRPHRYVELQTGMYYVESGQLKESSEEIEACPGGAVAKKGQHQAVFAENLASPGAITLIMPGGKTLQTSVAGLSYFDDATGKHVLIASVKDCIGRIVPPNQVVYEDAFDGVKASVRYTYTKNGFEQDVIIHERPPLPETFGFSSKTARLRVWTEVYESGNPEKKDRQIRSRAGTMEPDCELDFGSMKMVEGRAFSLNPESASKSNPSDEAIPVGKQLFKLSDGREYLIEEVTIPSIGEELDQLPLPQQKDDQASLKTRLHRVTDTLQLPARKLAAKTKKPMLMARAGSMPKGFVMDYVTVASSNNFLFKGDTTYYVSGTVNLSGTTTIEGNTVIKFANSPSAKLSLSGPLVCLTSPYRPALLTASNDGSAGDSIGSGTPTNYNGGVFIEAGSAQTNAYSYLRFCYAGTGIKGSLLTNGIWHCQFVKCGRAVENTGSDKVVLRNVLISQCTNAVYSTAALCGEHLTADQCSTFLSGTGNSGRLTNSIVTAVTTLGNVTLYNSLQAASGSGIYQVVGSGSYYLLTNGYSTNRNVGTTNINPDLLASLKTKTTYPPIAYLNTTFTTPTTFSPQAQRDTDQPDRGYHYEPLDYAFGGCHASTNMTFTAGTAVGWFRTASGYHAGQGIHIGDRQILSFNGTASSLCYWARCTTVQEGCNANWNGGSGAGGITGWADQYARDVTRSPELCMRFTRSSVMACEAGNHFRDDYGYLILRANDCEFWSGGFGGYIMSCDVTNSLMDRCYTGQVAGWPGNEYHWRNCTFRGSGMDITSYDTPMPTSIKDCAFDGMAIYQSGNSIKDFGTNAYLQGATQLSPAGGGNVIVTNYNWQVGPLGRFYLLTNSPLIDAGSLMNAGERGLYHHTIRIDQVKETNGRLDIGYHYVAVDAYDNPYDSDGDGIPDYIEDANGNGVYDALVDPSDFTQSDTDFDGLNDFQELLHGTNQKNPDTDNDGRTDGQEVNEDGTDPLNASDVRLLLWLSPTN
jgi:hypothetical protein